MLEAKFKNDPSAKYTFYDTADQKKKVDCLNLMCYLLIQIFINNIRIANVLEHSEEHSGKHFL